MVIALTRGERFGEVFVVVHKLHSIREGKDLKDFGFWKSSLGGSDFILNMRSFY